MRLKKTPLLLNTAAFLSLFVIISCNHQSTSPEANHPNQNFNYNKLSNLLNTAYTENSQTVLDSFFIVWDELLPPYTPQKVSTLSDTIAEAYQVFIKYYSPANLSRLSGGGHENFETDFRYIVIQNYLHLAVVDTNPQYYYYKGVKSRETYIKDFRPKISNTEFPSVYLSSQADSILFHFLFNKDSTYREDHSSRVNYLRQAIQLTHHHWIADYHKVTMPYAFTIIFNDSLTQALVNFRIFYQFGEAYLEKKNNTWILVSAKLTGIE